MFLSPENYLMAYSVPVLLHGYLGFSHFGPIQYFRGVVQALKHEGVQCLTPAVSPAGTIAERASLLANQLFQNDIAEFSLFAHSMGGLDARYLISYLDPDKRIKRLLTVSTPHLGSPIATWALESRGIFPLMIRLIGRPALDELTPEMRRAVPIPDRTDVIYTSYASCCPVSEQSFWLRPFGRMIPVENDGLVPVDSARWGQFLGTLHSDHLGLIGWNSPFRSRIYRPFNHIKFWSQVING